MKILIIIILAILSVPIAAQNINNSSEEKWGVVLEHPQMNNVIIKQDIVYYKSGKNSLSLDVYLPNDLNNNEPKPAIIFLPELLKDKSWEIYKTWGKLVAAYGFVGITVNIDKADYKESVKNIFDFITKKGNEYQIDINQLGIFATSHIPDETILYLINDPGVPAVKAVALYYREPSLRGPFRKDLPVLFVTDDQLNFSNTRYSALWEEVQKNKAPWTIKFGANMPHFFDAYADNDAARKIIRETIYFWKNHLEPISPPSWEFSKDREIIATLYRADYNKAAELLKDWLEENPDDQYALSKYAMVLFIEKRYAEAEPIYKKIKDLEPVYMVDFTKVLLAVNKPVEAERVLTQAINSGKLRRSPFSGLGDFLYSLKNYKEAIHYYKKAIEVQAQGFDYYNLARCYAQLNEKDKAFEALHKAIENEYGTKSKIHNDPDLESLRSDNHYIILLNKLKK